MTSPQPTPEPPACVTNSTAAALQPVWRDWGLGRRWRWGVAAQLPLAAAVAVAALLRRDGALV